MLAIVLSGGDIFKKDLFFYLFQRERESEWEVGGAEREGEVEGKNPKQTLY